MTNCGVTNFSILGFLGFPVSDADGVSSLHPGLSRSIFQRCARWPSSRRLRTLWYLLAFKTKSTSKVPILLSSNRDWPLLARCKCPLRYKPSLTEALVSTRKICLASGYNPQTCLMTWVFCLKEAMLTPKFAESSRMRRCVLSRSIFHLLERSLETWVIFGNFYSETMLQNKFLKKQRWLQDLSLEVLG